MQKAGRHGAKLDKERARLTAFVGLRAARRDFWFSS
jgi:hypothetical protein